MDGDLYKLDPSTYTITNLIGRSGANTKGAFFLNDKIYIYDSHSCNENKSLVYDTQSDLWSTSSSIPCFSSFYNIFGLTINDEGYFLSDYLNKYDPKTNKWERIIKTPDLAYAALVIEEEIYVLFQDKSIWKYNKELNEWKYETLYPGNLDDHIVYFSINSEAYFGLTFGYSSLFSYFSSQDFWQYSPKTKKWKEIIKLPVNHSKISLFFFVINNKGYLGYSNPSGKYSKLYIWEFNPL